MSESEPKGFFNSTPGTIIAAGTVCILLLGACVICGGALSFPLLLRSQRVAEEAARREQAEHNLRQVQEAMQKQQATQNLDDSQPAPGGDPADPSPQ
jgi:hypothetical protein